MQRVENVEAHIADAVKKGATDITGGARVAAFKAVYRSVASDPEVSQENQWLDHALLSG